MTDYRHYVLSRRQRLLAAAGGCAVGFAAAWLLFRHAAPALAACGAGLWGPRVAAAHLGRRRRERLREHFREMLQGLASLLAAGRSVENAFRALEDDLALLLGGDRSDLHRELRVMNVRCRNGEPIETAMADFADRSGLEDARRFAEAMTICKRAGGDLVDVVRQTAGLIGEKLEAEREVAVLLARKRFEARIMMGMPFGFVGALNLTAPDYMAALRQGAGWLVLGGGLLALAGCCVWIARWMEVRV